MIQDLEAELKPTSVCFSDVAYCISTTKSQGDDQALNLQVLCAHRTVFSAPCKADHIETRSKIVATWFW